MAKIEPAPLYNAVVEQNGNATVPWTLFFNSLYTGDTGTSWTPVFTSLGSTGTPTFTGKYYKLSQSLTLFTITVTPATDTTSTAGTTYCDFPLTMFGNGVNFAVVNDVGSNSGMCNASNNRIYTPAWTSVTNPVTIMGIVEAR